MKLKNIINEEIEKLDQTLYEVESQITYVFDMEGNLIDTLNSGTEAANKYGISRGDIYSAIGRKSIVGQKYYFSYDKNFVPPIKRANFNPLLRSSSDSRRYNYGINDDDFDF